MTGFNLLKQLSDSQKNSLVTLEQLKKDAHSIIDIRTELTARIWKLNIRINKCEDPVKVAQLRVELTKDQTALKDYEATVLLDNIRNKEIEEHGASRIGSGSPYML